MIIVDAQTSTSGGWAGMNVYGATGSSSASTEVAASSYSVATDGYLRSSFTFIVPNGWYWEIVQNGSGVTNGLAGTINRIEQWQL